MSNKGKRKGEKRSAGRPEEQGRIVLSEAEQEILCFHTSLEGRQAARMPIQNLDTMIVHDRGFPDQHVTSTPPPNLPFVPDSDKSHHFRPFLASFLKISH